MKPALQFSAYCIGILTYKSASFPERYIEFQASHCLIAIHFHIRSFLQFLLHDLKIVKYYENKENPMAHTKDKTIAIIDDCENDLQRLSKLIQAAGIHSQISCFSSAEKFINNNRSYTMAVLDIDLGDTNGIRLSKEISQRVSYIVYATALREKMREAFGYKVVGFINKCDTDKIIIDCFKTIFEEYFMRLIHLDTANGQIDVQQQEIIYITLQGRFPTCCLNENPEGQSPLI